MGSLPLTRNQKILTAGGIDYVGDIVDYDGLSDALNGVDGVLHLAAFQGD